MQSVYTYLRHFDPEGQHQQFADDNLIGEGRMYRKDRQDTVGFFTIFSLLLVSLQKLHLSGAKRSLAGVVLACCCTSLRQPCVS